MVLVQTTATATTMRYEKRQREWEEMGEKGGRKEATWHIFCTAKHERREERKEEDREGKGRAAGCWKKGCGDFCFSHSIPCKEDEGGGYEEG